MGVLRELGGSHAKILTCVQLARLLEALEIKSERMVAVESIAPRVIDPQNAQAEILQFFRFAEEKEKVARIFFENQNKRALSRGYSSKSGVGKRGGRAGGRGIGAHHRGRGGRGAKAKRGK